MSKRYLHIGCGNNILPEPFENLDIRDFEGVDHISKAYPLDLFEDNTFDLVYASHILEHYDRDKIGKVLEEWTRITKVDGRVRISVPSFENAVKIYQKTEKIENVIGPISGGQTYSYEFHYCIFDERSLSMLMNKYNLTAVHKWSYERTSHTDYWDFSQAITCGIPVSLNLEGRKKDNKSSEFKDLFQTTKIKIGLTR
tara:strand:+ start:190 stop:783 length:594 start_codon:yes stop_codon:yes gene_type:complete